METRVCKTCGVEKELCYFKIVKKKYISFSCKSCHNKKNQKYVKKWYKSENGKKYKKMEYLRDKLSNKKNARRAVNAKIARATMIRPKRCSICGVKCKPHAHHDDYSKRFEVRWVCCQCHNEIHGNIVKPRNTTVKVPEDNLTPIVQPALF